MTILYWEFCKGPKQVLFSQALRQGKWKAYLQTGKAMELFNLDVDPFEKQDLAQSKPKKVEEMMSIIAESHRPLPRQKE